MGLSRRMDRGRQLLGIAEAVLSERLLLSDVGARRNVGTADEPYGRIGPIEASLGPLRKFAVQPDHSHTEPERTVVLERSRDARRYAERRLVDLVSRIREGLLHLRQADAARADRMDGGRLVPGAGRRVG